MGDGPPGFQQGFSCPVVLRCHSERSQVSSTGLSPSMAGLPRPLDYPRTDLLLSLPGQQNGPTTRYVQRRQACIHIVWAVPRSLATTSGISDLISFPKGTEMFQFPPLATLSLCIQPKVSWTLLHDGFPIRRSTGQRLYTAHRCLSQFYHVLHRLLVPRHPPNALTSLTAENVCSRPRG